MLRLKTFFAIASLVWAVLVPWRTSAADGGEVVQLLERGGKLSESFLRALQIELGSGYQLKVVAAGAVPESLPDRLSLATELVEADGALASVWIDTEPGTRSATLYVVGRRAGRALLEVVQGSDARGFDLERMLAIKLAELLSELRAPAAHPLSIAPPAPLPPTAAKAEVEAAGRWLGALRLGPRFDVGLGTGWSRFGAAAALEPELLFRRWCFGLGVGVDAYPWLRMRVAASQVTLREVSPRLWLSVGWVTRELALTFHTGPTWSFLDVRGRTPGGVEDGANTAGFGWSVGLRAERRFSAAIALGALVELHSAATRMHFDVNDQAVLDRGRARLTLGIDLAFRAGAPGAGR